MRAKTRTADFDVTTGTVVVEILGPNPYRKAFIVSATKDNQTLSIGQKDDITQGNGAINFLAGTTDPMTWIQVVTDADLGTAICNPWFAVCKADGKVIRILEISYEPGTVEPAF